jgi:predicted Zn finger-like uncharacterized protein
MLTRCPACATHFRVTAEQLKARSGRVRCGECQHVFNALDSLIEEPMVVLVPTPPETALPTIAPHRPDAEPQATDAAATQADEVDAPPAPAAESVPETPFQALQLPPLAQPDAKYPSVPDSFPTAEPATDETEVRAASAREASELRAADTDPGASESSALDTVASDAAPSAQDPSDTAGSETAAAEAIASALEVPAAANDAAGGTEDSSEPFPVPPPPPRWPWAIGSLIALTVIGLQLLLAFRVEISVLWPEAKPSLVALCEVADCEVGLPTKVGMVGIEASDLHPDSEHKGRLALSATLKNRAPFAQQFPHLELTLTDTADQAVARKVLAPADYLPPKSSIANGMPSNADILVAIGIDSGSLTASGYRLYLFYP